MLSIVNFLKFLFIEAASNNGYHILSTYSAKYFMDITLFVPHYNTEIPTLPWVRTESPVMKKVNEDKDRSEEHNWKE